MNELTAALDVAARGTVDRSDTRAQELAEAAEAFEAILLRLLIRQMREAQLEGGFFGNGTGNGVYEGLFEERMAELLAGGSPLGIADALMRQWKASPGLAAEAAGAAREARLQQARDAYGGTSAPQEISPTTDKKVEDTGTMREDGRWR